MPAPGRIGSQNASIYESHNENPKPLVLAASSAPRGAVCPTSTDSRLFVGRLASLARNLPRLWRAERIDSVDTSLNGEGA